MEYGVFWGIWLRIYHPAIKSALTEHIRQQMWIRLICKKVLWDPEKSVWMLAQELYWLTILNAWGTTNESGGICRCTINYKSLTFEYQFQLFVTSEKFVKIVGSWFLTKIEIENTCARHRTYFYFYFVYYFVSIIRLPQKIFSNMQCILRFCQTWVK